MTTTKVVSCSFTSLFSQESKSTINEITKFYVLTGLDKVFWTVLGQVFSMVTFIFLLSPRTYSRRQIQTAIHTVRTAYSINISPSQTDSLQNRRFDGRIKDRRPQHLAVLISTHAYLFSQHFYFLNRWLLVDRCELGSLLSQYWYQTDRSNTRLCSNKKNTDS